jgi:signal transduction histidine kinase
MQIRLDTVIEPRHELRVLGLMLLALHVAVWSDVGGAVSRAFMLAHLGLFLLWQPLWSRREELDTLGAAAFVLCTAAFMIWLDWGLVTFWTLLLIGFVGGRVTVSNRDRYAYLMTLVFLLSELLLGCIPPMVDIPDVGHRARMLYSYGMLAVPVGLLLVPGVRVEERSGSQDVDFLYGLNVSLLSCVLALGSLLNMFLTGADYAVALVQTVLAIAVFLFAISWLWSPLAGFSGLGQIWERYLQNIGTPFEHWLGGLAELSGDDLGPEEFLSSAMARLEGLAWIEGVRWEDDGDVGLLGRPTSNALEERAGGVHLALYVRRPMRTALMLHSRLLLKLVGHFYTAKVRERELAERAHLQAIYETGARVTHDIKNLLQSLQTISAALERDEHQAEAAQQLFRRQLPRITQRLQVALDKLRAPADAGDAPPLGALSHWWSGVQGRLRDERVELNSSLQSAPSVPVELLDSVLDNLLENARIKRLSEPEIRIRVSLQAEPGATRLRVSDTGGPVDPAVARSLFRAPVESRNGLGVGLYQSARQAEQLGWRLSLGEDETGVCFELARQA